LVGRLRAALLLAALLVAGNALVATADDSPLERARSVATPLEQAEAQLAAAEWIDRVNGVYALQRMGAGAAPAAPALAAALDDDNGLVRMESAEALFRIGEPAVPLLVAALSSPRAETRVLAARTLGRIGLSASPALPALRAAAENDQTPDMRDAASFAIALIAPAGARGWLWKVGFEIGDEPYGIPAVLCAFVALTVIVALRGLVRSRRIARVPSAANVAAAGSPGGAAVSDEPDDDDDAADADSHADEEQGDEATEIAAADRLPPPQGIPHALAGLTAIALGLLVLFLGTVKSDVDVDERHGIYHFAALFLLFGYLFAKIGFKGAWLERQARSRARAAAEKWLRDRSWSRDGAQPIKADRVLPNVAALLLWVGFLLPFHTVWRMPFSWWGVWVVLAIFDAIAVAILVAVLRRVWRRLRAGRCVLRWQGVPVRPGGTFTARFESARDLAGGAPLEATLRCLRDRSENRVIGDEAAADAEEIYADKKTFPVHGRPEGGSWAQLSFTVPADARGTNTSILRPVRWVVTVALPIAGPDLRSTFPVPIYR
jgi:hypothetical protein